MDETQLDRLLDEMKVQTKILHAFSEKLSEWFKADEDQHDTRIDEYQKHTAILSEMLSTMSKVLEEVSKKE